MSPPRSALPLPRYTRRKPLKTGGWGYFFEPPTRARAQGCNVHAEALGSDYAAAVRRAEQVLLPALDSWRTRGLSDLVPQGPAPGTFDWLAIIFKGHQAWKDLDHKTQRMYEQGLSLFADYRLKHGGRAGSEQLSDFTKGFVDAVYAKLLTVEETDAAGNTVLRERRRFANAAMVACRRAWFIGMRAEEKVVPPVNPFSRMGLKARAPGQAVRETPTATWDELQAFRATAIERGNRSLATAALVAWEWLQREEHVFGAFEIQHYRPKERPDSVKVVHPKTGEEAWWPLFDEAGEALFPELTAELDEIKRTMVSGLVFRRDHPNRRSKTELVPWITAKQDLRYLRATVREIILASGLRDELSFTSFRHGGFTEGADSDWTDAELRAAGRHRSARQLPTYAKRTRKQLISATQKRRAERASARAAPLSRRVDRQG
jgi:hypothetical protein